MGLGISKSLNKKSQKHSIKNDWQISQTINNFNVVRNKKDGRQGQLYTYVLENRFAPKNQAYIFETRNQAKQPIIKVYEHQFEKKGKALIPNNQFKVVTERINRRLSQCPQLSFDQSLYVLDRCLDGFRYLQYHVGPFDVNSNMIGFTTQGQCKVWFNQNFGRNYPAHQKRTLQSTRYDQTHRYEDQFIGIEQIQMVRNIVHVIQDRCQQGNFPQPFRIKILQRIGFVEAKQIIGEQWLNSQRIRLNRIDIQRNMIKSRLSNLNLGMRSQEINYIQPQKSYQFTESYVAPQKIYQISSVPIQNKYETTYQRNF